MTTPRKIKTTALVATLVTTLISSATIWAQTGAAQLDSLAGKPIHINENEIEITVNGKKFIFDINESPEKACDLLFDDCQTAIDIFYDVLLEITEKELEESEKELEESEKELEESNKRTAMLQKEAEMVQKEVEESEKRLKKALEEANKALKDLKNKN